MFVFALAVMLSAQSDGFAVVKLSTLPKDARLVRGDPDQNLAVVRSATSTESTPAAKKLLDQVRAPLVVDRATPRSAFDSCTRAMELGSPEYAQCVDWRSHYVVFRKRIERARENVKGGAKGRAVVAMEKWLAQDGAEAPWLERFKPLLMSWIVDEDAAKFGAEADRFFAYLSDGTRGGMPPASPAPPAPSRTMTEEQRRSSVPVDESKLDTFGIKAAAADTRAILRAMKMGLRVEEIAEITKEKAWLAIAGKNVDGTPFRYSSFWRKIDGKWVEAIATRDDDVTRPKHFPPWFSFGLTAHVVVTSFAQGALPKWLATADPNGVTIDPDWEHLWPAMLDELARRQGS
jgi:hypothetical protein